MATKLDVALRVATLNVRGLGARRRQCQVNRLLADNDLDIVAVQETKIDSEESAERMVSTFRAHFNVCVCHSVGTSGGCVLFLRNSLGIIVESIFSCPSGRLLVVDFLFSKLCWRIICVYSPNVDSERRVFFNRLESYIVCDKLLLLVGDFNCVCAAADRVKCTPVRDRSAQLLNGLVHDNGLEDIGSIFTYGNRPQYTHFQRDSHARLDRIYASVELVPLCTDYKVEPVAFSDHCLVIASFGAKERSTRFNWNLWKLNAKLLEDEGFVKDIEDEMQKLLEERSSIFAVQWEDFKEWLKSKAIEKSCFNRHKEKQEEKAAREQLQFLISMESTEPGKYAKNIRDVKSQLERLDSDRYKSAVIRARAQKLWAGETPTKRALTDEKRYACQKQIRQIRNGDEISNDANVIQQVFKEYFSDLLGHAREMGDAFCSDFLSLLPRLEDDVKERLEMPITENEIEAAIEDLQNGKAPGPDGLGAEFYRTFKPIVAQLLLRVLTEAYERKQVPLSFTTSHIVLIPKSDDPEKRLLVGSYRPISLTNVDYKIYMKVLAKRLQGVITKLVGPHQTCGIKGRSIATNVHVARTVLECCDALGDRIAMMQLDLAKAFDRVSHDVIFCILEHANVGRVIIEGVRMAYANCTTRIIVNGDLSDKLVVRSSVRQGCPLSPLLFAAYLEPLCLAVIKSERISGFRLQSAHVKILAYADDIAVFCSNRDSITEVISVVDEFCKQTGCLINWDKSSGFWHGDWETMPDHFARLRWSCLPTQYLGVPLQYYRDPSECWNEQVSRAREKADAWQGRPLSMFSRASVCNLFLVSKIWYIMNVLCATRASIQKIHRVFAVFIWASNWERTSRTNLFVSVKEGGLGLVHLFLRQVVSRFIFLRDQRDTFLRTAIQVRLQRHLPEILVSSCESMYGAISGYMREVVLSFRLLHVRFSMEYLCNVSRRNLYKNLVDTMLPIPIYRLPHRGGPGQDVLKRVKRMPVNPSVKSFFFKLHSNTLPVKTWLHEKGIFVPWTINCLLCKKPETVEHVFLDCWDPIFHWDVLQRTVKKDFPLDPYGIRFLPIANEAEVPFDLIMLLGLHSLWKTRMQVRHADVNVRSTRENFIESVVALREVYRAQAEPPEWISVLDDLAVMKRF